ncbi:hypothetical protein M9Y10_000643 [Tritrichomonas musculus]|uniref:Uncharacterized protein n=1 Tax=Tritrichomonas musculus TaxID=1915356 RepID=A0ABR2L4T2_9EUKA
MNNNKMNQNLQKIQEDSNEQHEELSENPPIVMRKQMSENSNERPGTSNRISEKVNDDFPIIQEREILVESHN